MVFTAIQMIKAMRIRPATLPMIFVDNGRLFEGAFMSGS